MRLAAAALSLLAIACGNDEGERRSAELACQQRLVAVLEGQPPVRGAAPTFEAARTRFASLSPEGCNERQLHTAQAMERVTAQIAQLLLRLGERPSERRLSMEDTVQFRELQSSIEQFDHRRQRLIEELREMQAQEK